MDCTPELLRQAIESPTTSRVCAEIARYWNAMQQGELTRDEYESKKKELKTQLPVIMPHAAFPNGRRKNEEAVPSGLSMYDIDHIDNPRGYYAERIEGRIDELGIVMAHVTPSLEGLRLIFRMPQDMTLEEAQRWMSHQLGDAAYDECTKDLARCSFLVPSNYILFINEESLFAPTPLIVKKEEEPIQAEESTGNSSLETRNSEFGTRNFRGLPYADIINEYWLRTGGIPTAGERNVRLHKLAVNLRSICDNQKETLRAIMPRLGLSEEEFGEILKSACTEQPKGFSKTMESIVNDLLRRQQDEENVEMPTGSLSINWKRLPIGLRESLIGVPQDMHMPVLCAVMPLAAAYADQVEVEYCDGNLQRLGLMSIIWGEQASGKSVCKSIVDVWKRKLVEEDREARRIEEEWREKKKGRKANEKAPEDPHVLIRVVPVTVSCSTLLRRLKNANNHTLYSFGEELDTLRKSNGAGSWSSKYDVYRLGFDRGEWGQDYNSDQAESGLVNVAYNWTVLGTQGALRRCFRQDNIENGLSSRMLMARMPDASFREMPRFGRRREEDNERIQQAVMKLRSACGFIDTPRLRKAIGRWVEEKRQLAEKNIDHVMDTYRRRAAVIGFRCGVVHHLLMRGDDGREQKPSLDFALMMAEYALQQQLDAFGDSMQDQFAEHESRYQRRGTNMSIFDQLPPVFSMDDLRALKHGACSEVSMRVIVSRWIREGWIEKAEGKRWRKVKSEK